MCKYSDLSIGDKITLVRDEESMCNECGGVSDHVGSKRKVFYVGHVISSRYGICDRFNYEKPLICASCGEESNHTLVPCESGLDGFEIREKVEVERENQRTR